MLVKRLFLGFVLGSVLTIALIFALGGLAFPTPAGAQTAFTIEDIGGQVGLGTADLKEVVINIIKWALGILALVGVVMLIYGGVIWLTSGGNADKIDRAKRIIVSAIIGIIIVLLSWAIVTYVIKTFVNVTQPDVPTCDNPGEPCGDCLLCSPDGFCNVPDPSCGLPDVNVFAIRDIETAHSAGSGNNENVFRCSRVQPNFNTTVDAATVNQAANDGTLKIERAGGGVVDGTWTTADKAVTFKHPELFDAFLGYTAFFPKTLENTNGRPLSICDADGGCTDAGDHYEWNFTTNDVVDTDAPTVDGAYPVTTDEPGYPDRAVPRDPLFIINFSEPIDLTTIADADSHPIPGRFQLEQLDGQGGAVVGTVDPLSLEVSSGSGNRIEIRLIGGALLESFTWHRITVQDVEDLCGNPLQPPEIWEFETDDTVAGIRSYDPTGDSVCPNADLTVVFTLSMWNNTVSIDVNGGTYQADMPAPSSMDPDEPYEVPGTGGVFRILDPDPDEPNSGFKVYQFDPTDPLPSNTEFDVSITTDRVINPDGTTLSGSWSFATATPETCVCRPFVWRITPGEGAPGQCVTLQGNCFGGTGSHPAQPLDPDFDTDGAFPPPPNTSPILNVPPPPYNHYLVTTIPAGFVAGDDVLSQVTIDYDEDTYGQLASVPSPPFSVTSNDPASGPCLFSLIPDEGYRGTAVRATGTRFGDAPGSFTFFNNQPGPIDDWSDSQIRTDVPDGAASGTHDAYATTAGGQDSNPVPFTVNDYPPGELIVTSPWPTCQAVCVNAVLRANFRPFSLDVDPATVTDTTVLLKRCTDQSCTVFDPVNIPVTDITYDPDLQRVTFRPDGLFDIDRWYAALLIGGDGGIRGTNGETLGNTNTTYVGVPAYQWKFKTKDDPSLCTVDHVNVTPETAMITVQDGTKTFRGAAYASPDQCDPDGQQIDTSGQPWTWTVNPAADADLAADPDPTDENAVIQANQETTLPPPPDTAAVQGVWSGKSDQSQLTIDFLWCDETTDCTRGGACPGSTCNVAENRCTPVITEYTPAGGAVGTWTTIEGCYFGSYLRGICNGGANDGESCDTSYDDCPGGTCAGGSQVVYTANKQGLWPDNDICPNPNELWRNDIVRASELPNARTPGDATDDAIDGPFSVFRGLDDVSDSTNDVAGAEPILPNFDVNGTTVPGICAVEPDSGPENQPVTIAGQNFGNRDPAVDRVTFGLFNVLTYNSWTDALIDLLVPLGVPTGIVDTVVHKDTVSSNAWPFTVTEAACSTCVNDGDCDAGFGCGNNGCCAAQPTVTSTIPVAGADDVCLNTMIEATFSRSMDTGTMTDDTVRLTVDGGVGDGQACVQANDCASGICTAGACVGDVVDTTIVRKRATSIRVSPGLLLRNTEYRMLFAGLESSQGVRMPDYQWVFTTVDSDAPCAMTSVTVTPALWTPTLPAQQQVFTAEPKNGTMTISEIPGVYEWSWSWASSNEAVATLSNAQEPPDGSAEVTATSEEESGQSTLRATATITQNGEPAGQKSGTALVDYNRCENPWSFDDADGNCDIAGASCIDEHFHLDYCRDGNTLLPDFDLSVIKGETGDVLKQYLFKENDPANLDAIGIRVYANPEFLSPSAWYKRQFPFESGSPSSTVVDGYEAVQDGRTVYIAGTNLLESGPVVLAPTIYILSYNNEASSATRAIFNQFLERLRLNTNASLGPENKAKIIRDTKRLADLQDVTIGLESYKLEHDAYPPLDAGTYLLTMSTSRWPSWQSTLGNALGRSLPVDPVNAFASCPGGYDPEGCWNEPTKTFVCEPGSEIYAYRATDPDAQAYKLYANLEYDGDGNWITGGVGDPCSFDQGQGDSTCACFNYQRP